MQGSPKKKKIEEWKRQGRLSTYCDYYHLVSSVFVREYFLSRERREWELICCVHSMWRELPLEIYKMIKDKLIDIKFRCNACGLFNASLSTFNEYNGTCCEKCWENGAMGPDHMKWARYEIEDVCTVRWYQGGISTLEIRRKETFNKNKI